MTLAQMAVLDESALICDFAETYHVLNWRSLPARLAATLAAGFRPDSRIMLKIAGAAAPMESLLLSVIADSARLLVWQNTCDGAAGRNPPESILGWLTEGKSPADSVEGFDSPAAFMAWRESMLTGGEACG